MTKICRLLRPSFLLIAVGLPMAVSLQLMASVPASEITPVERPAAEFMPRGGLPNVVAKLEAGEPVTIAYLGGSITAQSGWRVLSRDWLQKKYPKSQVTGINAAIGGTGSDLGVFRVDKDALAAKPDLLFVEFAVNDASASPDKIAKSMEGIVRKTWHALPSTDICFVYTVTRYDSAALAQGRMKRSTRVMETVADHYGIPTVNLGLEVARMEKAGKLVMKSSDTPMTRVSGDELNEGGALSTDDKGRIIFSKDGVHPYPETGHVLYMQALARALDALPGVGLPGPHRLIEPLASDNWETAEQFPLNHQGVFIDGEVAKLASTDEVARKFANRMAAMWKFAPGASLSFKFKGGKASIYDLLGPDGAALEITVDGQSSRVVRFDGYSTYNRLGTLDIADNLPDVVHVVTIKVLTDKPDKAKILFDQNKADIEKSPKKYDPTVWYAGSIFIVGELVK